jgi:hypothetical protein
MLMLEGKTCSLRRAFTKCHIKGSCYTGNDLERCMGILIVKYKHNDGNQYNEDGNEKKSQCWSDFEAGR